MRKANQHDVEALYEIYMHESVNPYMGFDPCTISEFREIIDEINQSGDFLIYERKGRILCALVLVKRKRRLRHTAYIGCLAVEPESHRKGIGRKVLNEILNSLRNEGFKRIELFVACDNTKGIEFFKSLGFEMEGTLRNFFSRADSDGYFNEHIMALHYE